MKCSLLLSSFISVVTQVALLTTAVDQHSRATIRHQGTPWARSLDQEEWSSLLVPRTPASPSSSRKQSGSSSGGTTKSLSNKSTGSKGGGPTGQGQASSRLLGPIPPQSSARGSQGGAGSKRPSPPSGDQPPAQRRFRLPTSPSAGVPHIGGRVAGTSRSAFQKPSAPRVQSPRSNRPASPTESTFLGGRPAPPPTSSRSNTPAGFTVAGEGRLATGVTARQSQGQRPAGSMASAWGTGVTLRQGQGVAGGIRSGLESARGSREAGVSERGRDSRPSTSSGSGAPTSRRIVSGQPRFSNALHDWAPGHP